ncbi:glycoside hydrolase family 79 protein [Bipolaris oryzae ATCC 44560]|uniref:Glycoside hydrolase family 79 protein n=1 Tax=Bipolaris oryzae ATCC 44560 TaxID=930090 RepID=W6Z9N7_COCMI|nr:glycoside hydrolase family 79 protein [Bipolaris oryzae ATCC 44560]EUC46700.1 glycoside hydrolase family 79 protein [Bipolaris oryzae ATCC 44560]
MAYLRIAAVSFAVTTAYALPTKDNTQTVSLIVPETAAGASIPHTNSFASFSFEPAFWVDFFGNATNPNQLTFKALDRIHEHGGHPVIRPGGITMDSMIFDPNGDDVVRTTSPAGGVWRTTVGPGYYKSWSNFPEGTKFVSTLNFGNESLDIATGLAVASLTYQPDKVAYLELGNEPTNYNKNRWNLSTQAYVKQWKEYTASIDTAVNTSTSSPLLPQSRWWASSATTDNSGLEVRPAALIPAGINSGHQVSTYSIHSYAFSTCDPARARLATISNILNHTALTHYCDTEIYPSALAALAANSTWSIGEFNSISCSGAPNVTDTFAQALWVVDSELLYATRNATATFLHQGATLALQSNEQVNTPGKNGSPGFSTYSMLYPRDSELRGPARTLPSFLAQLFMAEAFAVEGTRVRALEVPEGVSGERFAGYAFYVGDRVAKVALVNMNPYYANSTGDFTVKVGLGGVLEGEGEGVVRVKRMTAPFVDSKDSKVTTWAGQSFPQGKVVGEMEIEVVEDGVVSVRGSEAVLVFFDDDVYGL